MAFLATVAQLLPAQPVQDFRTAIPAKSSDQPYEVITMGKDGIALVRDLQKYSQGNKKWQVDLLDTVLNKVWTTELDLDNRLQLVGFEHTPGRLYLLYRETQTTYYNFDLVVVDTREHSIQRDKVKFDLNFQLTHFTVAGTTALFGGYINSEPAVLLFNHTSDKPKVLPGLFSQRISLLDLQANHNNSFNVLLLEDKRGSAQHLVLRTFDATGNLLLDDRIEVDSKYTVLSGMTSRLVFDDMMIVGTYGQGNGKEVLGFYSLKVDPFGEQKVVYMDLPSISHFLDYMPEKKAKKIIAKASREKLAGRIPRFKSNLLPIRVEEIGDCYYVFAEIFHPPSNVTYYPYGSPYWNPYYSNPMGTPGNPYRPGGFDSPNYRDQVRNNEVRMIESLVLRYRSPAGTPEGISLKYEDVNRPILGQTGDFLVRNDSVVLAYKYKSDVVFIPEHEDPLSRPASQKAALRVYNSTDLLKDEDDDDGGLRHWYGRHFYVWGYRRVRVQLEEEVDTRYEFYVNRFDF